MEIGSPGAQVIPGPENSFSGFSLRANFLILRSRRKPMCWHSQIRFGAAAFALQISLTLAPAQCFINEVLFALPGPDTPNQYIELRGPPNYTLPAGTCFVAVNGAAGSSLGVVENVFDLSGRSLGGNGFLLLLQKSNTYSFSAGATALANQGNGAGFGSGSGSSIGHRGRSGRTDLPHASVTFLLIQATNLPAPGTDVDINKDGILDGAATNWTTWDAVGIADAVGDFAYGLINFAHAGTAVSGTVVPLSFTAGYLGRTGNTAESAAGAWVASGSLGGTAPNWTLGATHTVPGAFSTLPLNHLGLPNFGAANLPGIVAIPSGGETDVFEGQGFDDYSLGLNTLPAGTVVVQLSAGAGLELSIDGSNYFATAAMNLSDTSPHTVRVRAPLDNVIEVSPRLAFIQHSILRSDDLTQYPLSSLGPQVPVNILETEILLLNELKVNPPGTSDAPCEFIELRGPTNALLRDVYLLAIDGAAGGNPGQVKLSIPLDGVSLGGDGLLLITATNSPYAAAPGTVLLPTDSLNRPGGGLPNGPISFLLVASPQAFSEGTDLDAGDNGVLEGLPAQSRILDAIGWRGSSTNDIVYGGAELNSNGRPPDGLGRFVTNNAPQDATAWYFGELATTNCGSLVFDSSQVSSNFPFGVVLSPGATNSSPVQMSFPGALSGVVGDPQNPGLTFWVSSFSQSPDSIVVSASSSNPNVVPDSNLTIVNGAEGQRILFLNPVGVGYATITISAAANSGIGQTAFPYAASAMGRPGGVWHTYSSDASTALAVDSQYMIVGDNEVDVLRLYDRDISGAPAAGFDFVADLGLTPEEHGEVNIEASTRVGNRLFFMGAHSNSNAGVTRTNRNRIFAVDLSGSSSNVVLTYVGRYDYLKADLINWDSSNGHGKGSNYYGFAASAAADVNPKAPDGFNIEGLSMAPGSTNVAWIGFRAPIVPITNRTFALILPVLNFTALAISGGPQGSAVFGTPIELDLYGRGIRSIEGDANGYLISGGPPGDLGNYPNDFRLYTWTGSIIDQPQQHTADLLGLQPEGIVELPPHPWDTNTLVQLVSDNGNVVFYNDGIEDKHLLEPAFKKFRSDWVQLGATAPPMPVITAIRGPIGDSAITLTWRSLGGLSYRVERTTGLSAPSWTDASGDVVAAGPFATAQLPKPNSSEYYRVRVLWSP